MVSLRQIPWILNKMINYPSPAYSFGLFFYSINCDVIDDPSCAYDGINYETELYSKVLAIRSIYIARSIGFTLLRKYTIIYNNTACIKLFIYVYKYNRQMIKLSLKIIFRLLFAIRYVVFENVQLDIKLWCIRKSKLIQ